MRESHKQTGVKYARFSAVGLSNMLVDFGALNILMFLSPHQEPRAARLIQRRGADRGQRQQLPLEHPVDL
jgi:hypothetical protein